MYLKKLGFVKTGSSRLRAVTKVTKWSTSPIKGTKFYGMAVNGKDAGTLQLDSKNRVLTTNIYKEFRGMGLGKKMYGEILKQEGSIMPGHQQYPDATRLWKSLRKRYGPTSSTVFTKVHLDDAGVRSLKHEVKQHGVVANPKSIKYNK